MFHKSPNQVTSQSQMQLMGMEQLSLISMDKRELIEKIQERIRQEVIWEEVDKWIEPSLKKGLNQSRSKAPWNFWYTFQVLLRMFNYLLFRSK